MLRGSDPVKCQQWAERLVRFAKSGQTVSAFCRDEGVSAPSFYQWKRKLGRVNRKHSRLAKRRQRRKSTAFKQLHVSPQDASSSVSMRLPDGIVIDLGRDLSTIEKIVAQVLDHQASKGTG